jgi:hypothetical protein
MADLLNDIIDSLDSNVKRKNEYLEESYQQTNWTKIEQLETKRNLNRIIETSPEAQVNNAYADLERGAKLNKLTDPFRVQAYKETESSTARGLAKTIERYARQHTILQAFSS